MTYYSALHYAAKAEKSATSAANSARTAQTAASQASQASGKIIQLGFDGAMEDGKLVFKHAPSGVEIPYNLLDDYEYELDLAYNGDLDSLTTMVVKNGADNITFVSALHRSSTELARVADMDAVMRYDATTGYRWLFKATFKIAPNGAKVFLLYPVVAAKDYGDKTNCITEIPQDIKLELNNGVPTLKAGSKVYDGNGLLHTLETDSAANISYDAVQYMFLYEKSRNTLLNFMPSRFGSGDTLPADGNTIFMFYLTTDKKVYRWINNSWSASAGYSLPICIGTGDGSKISSIDQTFNGFGYIGSTVFALPNVKRLIPDGRNEDGGLKSIESTLTRVHTHWINPAWGNQHFNLLLWGDSIENTPASRVSKNKEVRNQYTYSYVEDENRWYATGDSGATWHKKVLNIGATLDFIDGKITSFNPRQPFQAVDYSDSSWVSAQGMPSERYIDLTLGNNGAGYTAPANGYFALTKKATASGQYIDLKSFFNDSVPHLECMTFAPGSGYGVGGFMPVRKGDRVHISYTAAGEVVYFRFVYAEGEE